MSEWNLNPRTNLLGRVMNSLAVGYNANRDAVQRAQTLDDLWGMTRALGAAMVWTNRYSGLVHVELSIQSQSKDELTLRSNESFDVKECLREVLDRAIAMGVVPRADGRFPNHR